MGKLKGYTKSSDIMNIDISIGNEQFTFNLTDELTISTDRINYEIKEQPSAFAFLNLLLSRLIFEMDTAEKEMESKFSEIYNRYKERVNENTGRVYDKDYAHHIANANPTYNRKRSRYIQAKHNVKIVSSAVKAFEHRTFLIQTVSANLRKEK